MVLARYWHIEMAPVLLKHWSPLFNPDMEQIGVRPLWVCLPGLPLQYWSGDVFVRIGNMLGTYLDYDKSYIQSKNRTLARILVHLDTREGLEEKITLQWRNFTRVQILDYEGVSFRCRRCHKVEHIFKECPLVKKSSDPPIAPKATKGQAVSLLDRTPVSVPQATIRAASPPVAECLHRSQDTISSYDALPRCC